jgi:hypothetical protein
MRHQSAALLLQAHISLHDGRALVVGLAVALLVRAAITSLDRFIVESAARTLHDDLTGFGAHMEFGATFRILLDDAEGALFANLSSVARPIISH